MVRVKFSCSPKEQRLLVLLVCVSLLVLSACCSRGDKALGKIRQNFNARNYEETILLCRKALVNDAYSAEVPYYCGLSLMFLGRDFEAFKQLQEASSLDATLALRAAAVLLEEGKSDLERGKKRRAAGRLKEAARLNPVLKLGKLAYLVAEEYYRNKDYSGAVHYYQLAIETYPDTSCAAEAHMHLANACTRLHLEERAKEAYRNLLEHYPRSSFEGTAKWNLSSLLLADAKKAIDLGNYEQVFPLVEEMLGFTSNTNLIQNGRFLLGEAYEGLAEYQLAYEQYQEIIRYDQGASGSVVERAQEKIEEFRLAGFEF